MSSPADPGNPFADGRFRDEQNPYATPGMSPAPNGTYYGPRRGLVNHLTVVAILNIVQGMLEMFMGAIFLFGMTMLWLDTRNAAAAPPNLGMVVIMFSVIAVLVLFAAFFRLFGAYCMFTLRYRTWALAASFCALISVFTFYCSITAIGVAIYTLIVLFNRETAEAFQMVARGKSARETRDYFRNLPV